jgi:ribosomal protein S18 acetylase RimI-like enzyme
MVRDRDHDYDYLYLNNIESLMNDSYRDPLTDMVVNANNVENWKKRLSYTMRLPDHLLQNLDIKTIPKDINKKKELYYEKIKLFIDNKSVNLLKNLISINKSNRDLIDRREEYNEIMRKYNKSIKEFYDGNNEKIVIRLVKMTNNDKLMAYVQYYNYKKLTKDTYTSDTIVSDVDDYILKHQMYGLYSENTNLMYGFLVIKNNRMFSLDTDSSGSGSGSGSGGGGKKSKQNTFYIQEVYVDSNARGRKLGKILLQYALLLCPKNKRYVSLMTYEGNIMANIAKSMNFILQTKESGCPVNKMLFIKKMREEEFVNNTVRITPNSIS